MLAVFWLLPLLAALAGPATPARTTLSGHLAHAPATDSVRLTVGFRQVSAALSPAGDFQVELPFLREPTPTEFNCGDQQTQLYLTPGDHLTLRCDYQDFDKTLVYKGRGSVVNNYLAQALYRFTYGPPAPGLLTSREFLDGTPAEARQQATALRQARRTFLSSCAQAQPLPAAFVSEQQTAIDAQYVTQLLMYAYQYGGATPLPAAYFDFMADAPAQALNRLRLRSIIDNSLLANMILGYGARLVPANKLSADPAEGPRLYTLATQELGEGRARDWALEMLLTMNIRRNLVGAETFYRTFALHNADSAVARSLRGSLAEQRRQPAASPIPASRRLAAGELAPEFTLADNAGKTVSLRDFRGKVVYLDFWGTWCPPCMRQMHEFTPALKAHFQGQDVVFLYVSVGDAEARWQRIITERQFTSPHSVHLRAPDTRLADTYLVQGFPTYYLIGRDGRLVQPYASAPSDGAKTVAAIEAALRQ